MKKTKYTFFVLCLWINLRGLVGQRVETVERRQRLWLDETCANVSFYFCLKFRIWNMKCLWWFEAYLLVGFLLGYTLLYTFYQVGLRLGHAINMEWFGYYMVWEEVVLIAKLIIWLGLRGGILIMWETDFIRNIGIGCELHCFYCGR